MVGRNACFELAQNGGVANYPSAGGRHEGSRVRLPREEGTRSRHQRLFKENVRKTETCGLRTLILKGSGFVLMNGDGISTPRVRHKGWQPSIKCASMTLKLYIFPFYIFYVFLPLFMFFSFLWVFLYFLSFCVFNFGVVDKGVSLAPTYSSIARRKLDLRSSFKN